MAAARRFAQAPIALLAALVLLAAACGSSAPSGSVASSESPTASSPVATDAAPSPSPTSVPGGGGDVHPIAEALVAALHADPLITHLEQTATASTTAGANPVEVNVSLSGDLSGEDLAIVISGSAAGQSLDQELVVVGDTAYVRQPGGEWAASPRAAAEASLEGLIDSVRLVDDPAVLEYVGVETIDGVELHHLTATGLPYEPAAGGTGTYDDFDIWVEADGAPVILSSSFSATDLAGNQVVGTTDIKFSNWGGPIVIAVPEGAAAAP